MRVKQAKTFSIILVLVSGLALEAPVPSFAQATSEGNAEKALSAITTYRAYASREPLVAVEKLVQRAAQDPDLRDRVTSEIVTILNSAATPECKAFLLDQLALIATAQEVPEAARLLDDPALGLHACGVLTAIPDEAAGNALRAALTKLKGNALIGVINALADRGDRRTVPEVAALTASPDLAVEMAAIVALGRLGGEECLEALFERQRKSKAAPSIIAEALLACADGFLAAGDPAKAGEVYERVLNSKVPASSRGAALLGLLMSRPAEAPARMTKALKARHGAEAQAAAEYIRRTGDGLAIREAVDHFASLPPQSQVLVLHAFEGTNTQETLKATVSGASSAHPAVRLAGLKALGHQRDASAIPVLLQAAVEGSRAERTAARSSLGRISSPNIDQVLIDLLRNSEADSRAVIIDILAARNARSAAPALLRGLQDSDETVRKKTIEALGALGDAGVCPALLKALEASQDEKHTDLIQDALASICTRDADQNKALALVIARMNATENHTRTRLLEVLVRVGGEGIQDALLAALRDPDPAVRGMALEALSRAPWNESLLPAIRNGLKDRDADVRRSAIQSLAKWPKGAALADLVKVAESTEVPEEKSLALRGLAASAQASGLPSAALLPILTKAVALAKTDEELFSLVSALGTLDSPEALAFAAGLAEKGRAVDEASLAALAIAGRLSARHEGVIRDARARIVQAGPDPSILIQAKMGGNLALDAKASSPDGIESDRTAGGDQAAIDNNEDTYWDEADNQDEYRLHLDFPTSRQVSAIRILGYKHHDYAPKAFEIICDGSVVKRIENAVYQDNVFTANFEAVRCDSLELRITGYYGHSPAIRELGVYHAVGK
jgi:HEAT repeat protein